MIINQGARWIIRGHLESDGGCYLIARRLVPAAAVALDPTGDLEMSESLEQVNIEHVTVETRRADVPATSCLERRLRTMGNSLRCCLACVLPCGALDVVRVVHLSGQVDEYGRHVTAGEVLAANPNHVLSRPCSQGVVRRILIVSPDSELKRGHIYFLIPTSTLPEQKKRVVACKGEQRAKSEAASTNLPQNDEIVPEKRSRHRRRRSGRVGVWRPHLERICEDL